jgi:hypothetical protein
MSVSTLKSTTILSTLIIILVIIVSAGGLLLDNLYRDNFLVTFGWLGNDLVTLFVATPILVTAVLLAQHGSWRAYLVWMGMLDYTLYNFCFYLFGSALNSFFLTYTAIFTLSIFALIFGLAGCDVQALTHRVKPSMPVRWMAGWMAVVALFLGAFWISQSLGYVFTGQVPAIMISVEWPTNVTAALDLSLVVSINALGAVWLWRRKPWGVVVAAVANVKGAVYMMALSATTITVFQAGALDSMALAVLWGSIGLGCLIVTILLLVHVRASDKVAAVSATAVH